MFRVLVTAPALCFALCFVMWEQRIYSLRTLTFIREAGVQPSTYFYAPASATEPRLPSGAFGAMPGLATEWPRSGWGWRVFPTFLWFAFWKGTSSDCLMELPKNITHSLILRGEFRKHTSILHFFRPVFLNSKGKCMFTVPTRVFLFLAKKKRSTLLFVFVATRKLKPRRHLTRIGHWS